MNSADFRFYTDERVRNYEVDWQGIVHNAIYLHYFETSRIDYLHHIGVTVNIDSIQKEGKVVLVRNEVNYKNPARYGDAMKVYTRISAIKNTSFVFEGMLIRKGDNLLLAENVAYHVWISPETSRPIPVPEAFRKTVRSFEGPSVQIAQPPSP